MSRHLPEMPTLAICRISRQVIVRHSGPYLNTLDNLVITGRHPLHPSTAIAHQLYRGLHHGHHLLDIIQTSRDDLCMFRPVCTTSLQTLIKLNSIHHIKDAILIQLCFKRSLSWLIYAEITLSP